MDQALQNIQSEYSTLWSAYHAKLTGGEPTNIPYPATKAKLSLSKRTLHAASVLCMPHPFY
jgi:hypothetical protein